MSTTNCLSNFQEINRFSLYILFEFNIFNWLWLHSKFNNKWGSPSLDPMIHPLVDVNYKRMFITFTCLPIMFLKCCSNNFSSIYLPIFAGCIVMKTSSFNDNFSLDDLSSDKSITLTEKRFKWFEWDIKHLYYSPWIKHNKSAG